MFQDYALGILQFLQPVRIDLEVLSLSCDLDRLRMMDAFLVPAVAIKVVERPAFQQQPHQKDDSKIPGQQGKQGMVATLLDHDVGEELNKQIEERQKQIETTPRSELLEPVVQKLVDRSYKILDKAGVKHQKVSEYFLEEDGLDVVIDVDPDPLRKAQLVFDWNELSNNYPRI